ncbi:MAG: putative PEP-binding protein [Blautia obeum]
MSFFYGAKGIGLLRSEFQYLGRENYPRENELFRAYKKSSRDNGRETCGDPYCGSRSRQAGSVSGHSAGNQSYHGQPWDSSLS